MEFAKPTARPCLLAATSKAQLPSPPCCPLAAVFCILSAHGLAIVPYLCLCSASAPCPLSASPIPAEDRRRFCSKRPVPSHPSIGIDLPRPHPRRRPLPPHHEVAPCALPPSPARAVLKKRERRNESKSKNEF
ncbi:hypothetical protein M0R45_006246 [Rubus argutus]|uniref:Uncharacterized protein n=1 Tax=Rubus argutus TaxID=59490 RepID=A0AAW1YPX4_RUBAR